MVHHFHGRLASNRHRQGSEQWCDRLGNKLSKAATRQHCLRVRQRPFQRRLRQGGDRARLHDIELPAGKRPFDIHRHAIQGFDLRSQLCQLGCLRIAQHCLLRLHIRYWYLLDAACLAYRHHLFFGDLTLQHLPAGLIYGKCIGRHRPGDDRLAQAPGSRDHYLAALPADRISREQHPGCLGRHQFLDHHR